MDLWTPNNDIAVSIGGKLLFSFKSLRLHQPINDHHRFELALDFEVAAKALEDGTEWLGKRIQIKRREAKSPLFVGVVTKVNACRENLDSGEVRVSGYSTTYLLENGESCHSWLGRTLGEIVRELCAKAGVQAQVEPEHDKSVGYVCQYGESDFTFIRRLAMKYQEWLYYDGAKLVFGKPKKPKAVKLEFDTTLTSFEMGVQTLARPARVFSYLSKHDHSMAENTPNKPSGLDRLGGKAFQASMEMFKEPALQYAHSRVHYMQEMEMYVRKKQEAEAAESHYVVGTSGEAELTVGSVVRITSPFRRAHGQPGEGLAGRVPHRRHRAFGGRGQLLRQQVQGRLIGCAQPSPSRRGPGRGRDADGQGYKQCRPGGQGPRAGADELADGQHAHRLDTRDDARRRRLPRRR